MKNKICIFLSACVNPKGMSNTALQDIKEREKQYMRAVDFYLEETNVPIVFVENTSYVISRRYQDYIDSGRLEYITFDGNNYNKALGKGYGEGLIIKEGFKRSKILRNSKYVVKITGRLIIRNINHILCSKLLFFDNIFRCDFRTNDFLWSMVFVIKSNKLKEIFNEKYNQIDESKWVLFEHILYTSMYEDKKTRAIPFLSPPVVEGTSGSWNISYADILNEDRRARNIKQVAYFYLRAERRLLYYLCRIIDCFYNLNIIGTISK